MENHLPFFKKYYETKVSSLILFAKRFVPSEVAEDIVHDIFLETWEQFKISTEAPSHSYLFMAVRNRCLNVLKREQVKDHYIHSTTLDNQIMGLDYYDSYERQLIDREDIQTVYDQIERLPEKCRLIFKMAYFEDKKNAEIAEILDLSVRTVEHQLYLGLKTLRDKLTTEGKTHLFFMFFF